jgi:hypothetical protein
MTMNLFMIMNSFPQFAIPISFISAPVGEPLDWFAHYGAVRTWLLLAVWIVGAAFVGTLLAALHGNWRPKHCEEITSLAWPTGSTAPALKGIARRFAWFLEGWSGAPPQYSRGAQFRHRLSVVKVFSLWGWTSLLARHYSPRTGP